MSGFVTHTAPLPMRLARVALALIAFFVQHEASAQERTSEAADTTKVREVEIIQAPRASGGTEEGLRVRRLYGDTELVLLRQDETALQARYVTQYLDRDEILFTNDVLIVEDGDSLRADTVLYNKRLKTGRARGHVRLTDGEVTVLAPSALYYTEEKRSVFEEGVTLIDSTSTLTSQAGEYFSDEERAEFYGDVRLDEERTRLVADSITYFRETEISIARSNVFIDRRGGEAEADSTTRTLLYGEWAYSDEPNERSRTEGRPLLVQVRTDSTGAPADTLIVRARTLLTSQTDSLRRLTAIDSVKIWQRDYAAIADSAVFDRIGQETTSRDDLRLYGAPVAWFEQSQVSGDTLRVTALDGETDSLFVRENTFVAQLDTLLGRVQQLKGRYLVGVMRPDSLRRFTVWPNAEAIRFLEKEGGPNGAVQVSADRIGFIIAGDKLRQARILGGVQGKQYSENILPSPLQLEGYRWMPEAKPTKKSLLEGVPLPPGPEEEPPPQTEPVPIVRNAAEESFREDGGGR